jgi:FAD binding domain
MDRRTALQALIGLAAIPSIASAVQRPNPTRTADVIVVGAGFAGLAAAKACARPDWNRSLSKHATASADVPVPDLEAAYHREIGSLADR